MQVANWAFELLCPGGELILGNFLADEECIAVAGELKFRDVILERRSSQAMFTIFIYLPSDILFCAAVKTLGKKVLDWHLIYRSQQQLQQLIEATKFGEIGEDPFEIRTNKLFNLLHPTANQFPNIIIHHSQQRISINNLAACKWLKSSQLLSPSHSFLSDFVDSHFAISRLQYMLQLLPLVCLALQKLIFIFCMSKCAQLLTVR